MRRKAGVSLSKVHRFSPEYIGKLAALYINTAEELVSLTISKASRERIAEYLEISLERLTQLVDLAKAALPENVRKEMAESVDTSEYGLGALEPESGAQHRTETG